MKAKDAFGNATTPVVQFGSSDGSATLPANATLAATGTTFTGLRMQTLGDETITVADVSPANASASATSNSILVYGNATQFAIATTSSTVTAGTSVTYTLTAGCERRHRRGLPRHGSFHGRGRCQGGRAGNFEIYRDRQGGAYLHGDLQDGGQPDVDDHRYREWRPSWGRTTASRLSRRPPRTASGADSATTGIMAGTTVNFNVTAEDVYGNIDMNFAGTVGFTSTRPARPVAGQHHVGVRHRFFQCDAGDRRMRTITASSTGVTKSSATFGVVAAAPASFIVSAPAKATAGMAFTVTVTAKDQFRQYGHHL